MARGSNLTEAGPSRAAVAGACALVALLAALIAVDPAAATVIVPVLVVLAVAAMHGAATARISAWIAVLLSIAALAVLAAVAPGAAVVAAGGLCVAAVVVYYRRTLVAVAVRLRRPAAAFLGACLGVAVVLGVAVHPRPAVLATAGTAALAAAGTRAWDARGALGRAALAARRPLLAFAAAVATAGLALGVAISPATALLAALVAGIAVLAVRSPALALGAAVLLFEFEGSVKILLGLDGIALPGGNRATGAAAIDLALFAAVASVLAHDRLRAPRALWSSATRAERIVIGVMGGWLALSVVQIAQGGDIGRGLHGFRLFQWYTLVALAGLAVFSQPRLRSSALHAVLGIGLVVSLYAAVRVVIGPADAEREFATAVKTVTMYGDTLRAVGSFSSAIGLSSFLTPLAVFSLLLGLLLPRLRLLSWIVAGLALVGLIGSYSRASLFGVALGLAFGLVLVFAGRDLSTRRKLVSAAVVLAMVAVTYGGLWAASQTSPELRDRAQGVIDPLNDESVRLRFETWELNLENAADHPLGQGVGAVGAASAPERVRLRTTDNSFLKVLVEQGFIGLLLFAGGMLGAVVLLARRLRTAGAELRPAGLAALAGFVAFLGISLAGESVEQPGKVLAWGLLGLAAAHAFAATPAASERA